MIDSKTVVVNIPFHNFCLKKKNDLANLTIQNSEQNKRQIF
jgi:hypothetical protein